MTKKLTWPVILNDGDPYMARTVTNNLIAFPLSIEDSVGYQGNAYVQDVRQQGNAGRSYRGAIVEDAVTEDAEALPKALKLKQTGRSRILRQAQDDSI